ncbi:hypothetical protein AB6A40_005417 [Gnathostoma spinigerum]|uniref:Carboxylesterase type B domain-containing protein n=1 Tax=Gnathostoma spinigerum TaxID=75299 RepID=A0ABD6EFI6_9BILA
MLNQSYVAGNFWNIYNLPQYFDKTEQPQLTRDEFLHCVQTAFATRPIVVRDAASFVYMGEKCEESSSRSQFYAEQVNQMVGDSFFTCDSVWLAEQMRDAGVPVYIYYFDQPSSANPWPRWTGVMHGYEIEYVFGIPIYNTTAGYTPKEKAFSEKIINSWGSFAINGVPRLSERAGDEWPEFGSTNKWIYLRGGSHIKPIERRKEKECAMWRSARDLEYEKYLLQRKTSNSPSVSYRPVIVCLIILALQSLR